MWRPSLASPICRSTPRNRSLSAWFRRVLVHFLPDAKLGDVNHRDLFRAARKATPNSTKLFSYKTRKKRTVVPAVKPDTTARAEEEESVDMMVAGTRPPICSETIAVQCFHASQGQGRELWEDFVARINKHQVTQLGDGCDADFLFEAYEKWSDRARYLAKPEHTASLSSVRPFIYRLEDALAGQPTTTAKRARSRIIEPDSTASPKFKKRKSVPVTPYTELDAAAMSQQERTALKAAAADALDDRAAPPKPSVRPPAERCPVSAPPRPRQPRFIT